MAFVKEFEAVISKFPFVAASYQFISMPGTLLLPETVTGPMPHLEVFVPVGAAGVTPTVAITGILGETHPPGLTDSA